MRILFFFSLILLISCGQEKPNENILEQEIVTENSINTDSVEQQVSNHQERLNNEEDGFIERYKEFALQLSVKGDLSSIIHENYGLYVVKSNGAMPQIDHLYKTDDFFYLPQIKTLGSQREELITLAPQFEKLPTIICDDLPYDKEGCFAAKTNPLKEGQIWNYVGLNEKEIQAIEKLSETVIYTVVNTYNFTFQFSQINDEWYLTFVDVRTPCSA